MKYNFDEVVDRHNTNCVKWDKLDDIYGPDLPDGTLALWIADMDFAVAPPILEALKERIQHPVLGYTFPCDEFFQVCVDWIKRHYDWDLKPEALIYSPGVVPALNLAVLSATEEGDKVVSLTPVYPPFKSSATNHGRIFTEVDLLQGEGGTFSIDFEALEEAIDENTKILMLCSPHNPTGRVFTEEELTRLGELAVKHDLVIVSDEIHADFIYSGHKHRPIASLDKRFEERSITCYAPSKTFNVAGLSASIIAIPNPELRSAFEDLKRKMCYSGNLFGYVGLKAAWEHCDDWLSELLVYLEDNRDYLVKELQQYAPLIKCNLPESTYLIWLDCRELMKKKNLADDKALGQLFVDHGLALNQGISYGEAGQGFMRLNFACPKSYLEEAIKRIDEICTVD